MTFRVAKDAKFGDCVPI
jgi:WD repeat-containing protein 90